MKQIGLLGFKNLTGLIYYNFHVFCQPRRANPTFPFPMTNDIFLIYFTNDFAFSTAAVSPERSFPPAVA